MSPSPDMEVGGGGLTSGMVETTLDAAGKPMLSAAGVANACHDPSENFAQWHRGAACINLSLENSIELTE